MLWEATVYFPAFALGANPDTNGIGLCVAHWSQHTPPPTPSINSDISLFLAKLLAEVSWHGGGSGVWTNSSGDFFWEFPSGSIKFILSLSCAYSGCQVYCIPLTQHNRSAENEYMTISYHAGARTRWLIKSKGNVCYIRMVYFSEQKVKKWWYTHSALSITAIISNREYITLILWDCYTAL